MSYLDNFTQIITNQEVFGNERIFPDADTMPILLCTDNSYMIGAGVLISSIAQNNDDMFFDFHILVDVIAEAARDNFAALVEVYSNIRISIDVVAEDVFADYERGRWPKNVYYRLLIGKTFYPMYKKGLYIDVDVLCLASLRELLTMGFDNKIVLAVKDPGTAGESLKLRKPLDFFDDLYFYSGVLYVDLKKWEEYNIADKAINYLKHDDDAGFPDQDALNIVLAGKWKDIEMRYDLTTEDAKRYDIRHPIVFLHYTKYKPWIGIFESIPTVQQWIEYKNVSPWRDTEMVVSKAICEKHPKYAALYFWRKGNCLEAFYYSTKGLLQIYHRFKRSITKRLRPKKAVQC